MPLPVDLNKYIYLGMYCRRDDYDLCQSCFSDVGNEEEYMKLDRALYRPPALYRSPHKERSFHRGRHFHKSVRSIIRCLYSTLF